MKTKDDVYSIRDLAEASYLIASNVKLISIQTKQGICWFTFPDAIACQKLADNFWYGEALVNARTYSSAMRMLKDAIHRGHKDEI